MKIGISSCLCGNKVRYDGSDKKDKELLKLLQGHQLIAICPEIEAGFPVPRKPIEIRNDKIITQSGEDVSDALKKGCRICLEKSEGCAFLILKQKSPSCGKGKIYDGSFSGKLIDGNGFFTSLAEKEGIKIFSEEEIEEIKKELR